MDAVAIEVARTAGFAVGKERIGCVAAKVNDAAQTPSR